MRDTCRRKDNRWREIKKGIKETKKKLWKWDRGGKGEGMERDDAIERDRQTGTERCDGEIEKERGKLIESC